MQTDFFLTQLRSVGTNFLEAQCFTDAFSNSARTVTLSMQAVMGKTEGFDSWYVDRQAELKKNPLALFFVKYRNVSSKIGDTVVRRSRTGVNSIGEKTVHYYFIPTEDLKIVPEKDVVTVCAQYFATLLQIVYDAMIEFKYSLDDSWYFTSENFYRMGKTFEDAVSELGFPAEWANASKSLPESERWRVLRKTQTIGCQINEQFMEHLGKIILGPDSDRT